MGWLGLGKLVSQNRGEGTMEKIGTYLTKMSRKSTHLLPPSTPYQLKSIHTPMYLFVCLFINLFIIALDRNTKILGSKFIDI